ncbi:PaaI family thioesterase [Laribacter hongkongensis]|uniref:PaaI family thioesterase n=1 Tax=Laribacter hongkongensis TaxID=168471 RepID=UPI001EFEC09F|nr:PaaI family thioesterase [Laribacter hongkongensis]MCG9051676.1 PaaI family thioesterase [Laribacter hongkongensis]
MSDLFNHMQSWFVSLPHCATLGIRFVDIVDKQPCYAIDWREDLVGNPATGVLHGGVITSLIDTTSALSIFPHLPDAEAIATLDLRIDYLKPAIPGQTVYCRAECYKLARQVAFTRAVCHHGDASAPIAHGVATFMRASSKAVLGGQS